MSGFLTANRVQASPTDKTEGTLVEKLVAGSNIEFTLVFPTDDYERLEISGTGTNFANVAQALGEAAGSNVGYIFKSDGAGSGSMVKDVQTIGRRITVSSLGTDADYSSISTAINAAIAGGADAYNVWEIRIFPGTYTEPPMVVPPGIVLQSDLGERPDVISVVASDPNNDLFTVTGGLIAGMKVSGVTNPTKCLFRVTGPSAVAVLRGINIRNCSTGIQVENGASLVIFNLTCFVNSPTLGTIDKLLYVTDVGTNVVVFNNSIIVFPYILPFYSTNPIQTAMEVHSGARLHIQGGSFNIAYKNNTSYAVLAGDGAVLEISSCVFENCNHAIHIDAYGTNTQVIVQSSFFDNNVLNFKDESSTGVIFGTWTTDRRVFENVPGAKLLGFVQYRDDQLTRIIGNAKYNYVDTNKDVDLDDFFADNVSTGVCEGGDVTAGAGLTVNISAGDGWIHRIAEDDSFWVHWDAYSSLALIPSATNYVFYDSNIPNFVSSVSPPSDTGILLATVITDSSNIRFLHTTHIHNDDGAKRISDYLLATRKRALISGLTCIQGTTNKKFEVSSGSYYIGLNAIDYYGSGGDATFSYFYGTAGATEVPTQTQINIDSYDLNGSLVSMHDGYYKADTVVITSDGRISVIYDTEEFSTEDVAAASSINLIPPFLDETDFYIANLVILKGTGITKIVDVRPQPALPGAAGSLVGITIHSQLAGLDADDHKQYLLANGSRPMAGTLQMGGNAISNVGTINSVSITAHGSRHNPGGIDAITTGIPHAVQAGVSPLEGTDGTVARSDHQHGTVTGAPSTIGAANAEGASNSIPRLDHIHAHGVQSDGYMHQLVTTGLPGFMNGTDKRKLNGISDNAAALTSSAPADVTKAAASVGVGTTAARSDHKHDVSTAIVGTVTFAVAAEGSATSLARSDHTHGLTSPVAPANVTKAAAAAGSSANVAREDHKHDITTAAPNTVTFGVAAEGSATSLARSDHNHALTTPAAPANVTKAAAAAGSSANVAREDHKHDITTAAPPVGAVAIANSASEGTATSLARSDHQHAVAGGTPVDVGITNADGTATTFSRSDHVHAGPVFGRDYQFAASEGTSTNATAVLVTKTTLTTPALTGTYRVNFYAELSLANNDREFLCQLFNVTDNTVLCDIRESIHVAATGNFGISGFQDVVFTGALKSFIIQFSSPSAATTVTIQRARIELWRVS